MPANEMSNSVYTVRNYQLKDFDKYVLLKNEAEELEPAGRCISPQVIADRLGRPNYSPNQDLFIAEIAENIVGFIDATPEMNIRRVILDCWIHPVHRKRGLATKLLSYATNRAKELGAQVTHVNIIENNLVAQRVLSRLNFSLVRRFLELSLDIADIRWSDINQSAPGYHYLQRGEEDKLAHIQNRAFVGTWGYNPSTVEEIIYRTNLSTYSPEDIALIYSGNKVIGYCWTGTVFEEKFTSERKGRIFMLGVDPNYRRKGIGKMVLQAGLAHLKSKGSQIVELSVDVRNIVACALYKSIGFKVQTSSLWYEKVIN
ncbi:GNAT family N-acetyltransferase [Chloroflexota bacterium]